MSIPLSELNQLATTRSPDECVRNLRRVVQDPFGDVDRVSVVCDDTIDPRRSPDQPVSEFLRQVVSSGSGRLERQPKSPPEPDEPAWAQFLASQARVTDPTLEAYDLQVLRPVKARAQRIGWLLFWRSVGASPISQQTREAIDTRMPFVSFLMMDLVKTATPRRDDVHILEAAVERMVRDGGLGKRETSAVLRLMRGWSYSEIGEQMHISVNTVGKHIKSVYRKLDAHSALAIVNRYLIEPLLRERDGEKRLDRHTIMYP